MTPQEQFVVPGGSLDVQVSAAQFDSPITIGVQVPPTLKATLSSQLLVPPLDSAVLRLTALTGTPLGMHTAIVQLGDVKFDVDVHVVSAVYREYLPLVRD